MKVCETPKLSRRLILKESAVNRNTQNSSNIIVPSSSLIIPSFYGKDLIKPASFDSTIFDNYFQLPPGCSPDACQVDSAKSLYKGNSLLATLPTGTGKTAIAHYVITKNMKEGKKTFYTTPLKALSNQKLKEFREIYGEDNVGILTGDRKKNRNAPIIVMTTEVYRNICLANHFNNDIDILDNLGTVVFDEFHYLGDPDRGPVWEESVMFTPDKVQTLALSATVGNPEQIQNWLSGMQVKPMDLVKVASEDRHVPLDFNSFETQRYKDSQDPKVQKSQQEEDEDDKNTRPIFEDYEELVVNLKRQDRLPAIFFVFSKRYSRSLVNNFAKKGPDLTTAKEKKEIKAILNKYSYENYMGESLNTKALLRGYCVHNAGMLPIQKQLVEELFQKKLTKVVMATETLAAGINMPARTVLISSYQKPSNEKMPGTKKGKVPMRELTPNEFHQMAGRAGRRGMDDVGYVYTLNFDEVAEGTFEYLVNSSSNDINSQLNPDFSFLANYYNYSPKDEELRNIFEKSFYVYSNSEPNNNGDVSGQALEELCTDSSNKKNVLLKMNYIEELPDERFATTDKGKMLSVIKGYDQLTLIESIDNKLYKDFSPQMLALTMAAVANPYKVSDEDKKLPYTFNFAESSLAEDAKVLDKLMNQNIKKYLNILGRDPSEFKNLAEMYDFAINYKGSYVDIITLKSKLDDLSTTVYKLEEMNKPLDPKYPVFVVEKKLKKGQTVPNTVLEDTKRKIEKFKQQKHFQKKNNSFDKLIDNNQKLINKSSTDQAKKLKIHKNKLYAMKYLDSPAYLGGPSVIEDAINNNKRFESQHNYEKINNEFKELKQEYSKAIAIKPLRENIAGCMQMDLKKDDTIANVSEEIATVKSQFAALREKADKINSITIRNQVRLDEIVYSEMIPQIVYKWMVLNKINSNSVENWKHLIRTEYPETKESLDEGSIFRGITQTIDLLNQVIEVSDCALKNKTSQKDIEYYEELKASAEQAVELLMRDPVKFD